MEVLKEMNNASMKCRVGAFALALVLVAAVSAKADELPAVAGKAVAAVKKAASKIAKAQRGPGGIYGRDHCSPYDETMKPVNDGNGDGENGYYCVSKNPASVTCKVVGTKCEQEGELGLVCRPVLGECTPRGGWAGPGTGNGGPQAP